MVSGDGIEPSSPSLFQDLLLLTGAFILVMSQSALYLGCDPIQQVNHAIACALPMSYPLVKLAPEVGIEPTTLRLTGERYYR